MPLSNVIEINQSNKTCLEAIIILYSHNMNFVVTHAIILYLHLYLQGGIGVVHDV